MIKYRFNLEENIVFFPGLVIEKQRLEGTIHKLCHEKVKLKKSPKKFIFYIYITKILRGHMSAHMSWWCPDDVRSLGSPGGGTEKPVKPVFTQWLSQSYAPSSGRKTPYDPQGPIHFPNRV